jgi:hypothetical protein
MTTLSQTVKQAPAIQPSAGFADRIELLRRILERQQSQPVSYEEAQEVGESLVTFFTVLADESVSLSLQPKPAAVR